MIYVRFEAADANARGAHTGIFGLANGLARSGRLEPEDWNWWRANNDWFDCAHLNPATVDPTLFDKAIHPLASCWFKDTATGLLARIPGYLDLLDRHSVLWRERRSTNPGLVRYEDHVQVVVTPKSQTQDAYRGTHAHRDRGAS